MTFNGNPANVNIEVIEADYLDRQHGKDIPFLLNEYATDPMGGGVPLTSEVHDRLVPELARLPHAFSILAYVDNQPAGLANCFEAFSTFTCKPLVNIHDICVHRDYRGLGLSQMLLGKVEAVARARGCCKLTLEVLSNNTVAQSAYQKFGFSGYELDPGAGVALFWQKKLTI